MSLKSQIINKLSNFWRVQKIYQGKAIILMLHRIAPLNPHKLPANENMKVSPEFLENFIVHARKEGYNFISLDSLYEDLCKNTLKDKSLIITIDDGYKDNLEFGYPIFAKHDVPFCIYVCTSFPQREHNMWWFGLEDYLLTHHRVDFFGQSIDINTLQAKQEVFLKFREVIIANSSNYQDAGNIMEKLGIFYNPGDYDSLALSWEEIKIMLNNKITTIGHHTHTHPIFNNLADDQIISELTLSNDLFSLHLGYIPKHFAYPFGSVAEVSKKHFQILKNAGFKTATTTRKGTLYPQHKKYLSALPRVFFNESFKIQDCFKIRKKIIVTD
ncbi:polysaccharide deacetylase family protein [Helicobacter sp. 11S03491-1]|uniref:polysaccharide deacetylase family protein n=1 Tax=Helicobacter sp. 11S03491-1 TaxID=1476196 RepID=UPI000BA6EEB5|nr:polysaccharide deacetylase family protein [Helicobacter sp. 11S03491-1]PAF43792.1 polysaccharide deacetylase [Helicobacter sp. 11S03491-1]